MSHRQAVGPQLMGTPGHGPQCQPASLLPFAGHLHPAGSRRASFRCRGGHLLGTAHPLLAQGSIDNPAQPRRNAGHERPVDLAGVVCLEACSQVPSSSCGSCEQKNTRSITVQPMHQPWAFVRVVLQDIEHPVEVAAGTTSPLDSQPGRFVESDDPVISIENAGSEIRCLFGRDGWRSAPCGGACLYGLLQGGDAQPMSFPEPELALDSLAVNAYLSCSQHAFQAPLRHLWKALAEPAIEALVSLFSRYDVRSDHSFSCSRMRAGGCCSRLSCGRRRTRKRKAQAVRPQ